MNEILTNEIETKQSLKFRTLNFSLYLVQSLKVNF